MQSSKQLQNLHTWSTGTNDQGVDKKKTTPTERNRNIERKTEVDLLVVSDAKIIGLSLRDEVTWALGFYRVWFLKHTGVALEALENILKASGIPVPRMVRAYRDFASFGAAGGQGQAAEAGHG